MKKSSVQELLKQNGFVKIPLGKNKVGHFQLKADINGKPGKFILDTGASATVINEADADGFNLVLMNKKSKKAGGLGGSGIKVRQSTGNVLSLKGFKADKLKIAVLDLSHVIKSLVQNGAGKINGVIGADILKKFNAIIDYKGEALYLKKKY